ncbi:integrase core domain-containing protein [Lentzea tibetensis]|uniref:integrase core domain-containing protein n=1 Tax=Lentzea tibetensis TaxID=2591470 RepID=UPI001F232078|nr:integrase core domain-containing protein [Lentzea tibetensis]
MDLQDAGITAKYFIRDRDRYTTPFDTVLADNEITIIKAGIRITRMNAIMERWIRTCRAELLDRILIPNRSHLLHALRDYETSYNQHRPHRALERRSTTTPAALPVTDPGRLAHLDITRHDRLGGILHEYHDAA